MATTTRRYRPRRLRLRDGAEVMLRAIVEADAAEIVGAFERLSADSRYYRFMRHKKQLDLASLERGVHPRPGREFAITVAEDWRGAGLATQLLASLVRRARRDGYRTMEGLVIADNARMLALARTLGFTLQPVPGDATVIRVQRAL